MRVCTGDQEHLLSVHRTCGISVPPGEGLSVLKSGSQWSQEHKWEKPLNFRHPYPSCVFLITCGGRSPCHCLSSDRHVGSLPVLGIAPASANLSWKRPSQAKLAECLSFSLRLVVPASLDTSPKKGLLVSIVRNMIAEQFHKSASERPGNFLGGKKANKTNPSLFLEVD